MKYVLSPDEMRSLEKTYMETSGQPSSNLMERAAQEIARVLIGKLGGAAGKTVAFACGPGNNGGDGYAAARLFADEGGCAVVWPVFPTERLNGDARLNAHLAQTHPRVFFANADRLDSMPVPDAWVDAMFGIGLTRNVEHPYDAVIERMAADRAAGCFLLAVDICSGLDSVTGRVLGANVTADATVIFEYAKYGHYFGEGMDESGELIVRPIGIPREFLPPNAARLIEPQDLLALWKPRRRNSHKGDYGHLLIVAGSGNMPGAAVLAAQAALHSGAGLVTVACGRSVAPVIQAHAPCAMCIPLPETDGILSQEAVPLLMRAANGKTALAVGPGLSSAVDKAVIRWALESGLPAAFDADALNCIAHYGDELKALLIPRHVLTPHPGEAARLVGGVPDSPAEAARSLCALGATALYKGAATVICGQALTVSISGTPGMAKGGSGDVLTGLLGGLLAQGINPEDAACMSSEIHGLAGEAAARAKGDVYMTALDIIEGLREVFMTLEGRGR